MSQTNTPAAELLPRTAEASVLQLLESEQEVLATALAEEILAHGNAATPHLLKVLLDEELWETTAPGGGYASIHAAQLLIELQAPEAMEPLLDLLGNIELDLFLFNEIAIRIAAYGPTLLEPVLRRCDDADAQHLMTWGFLLTDLKVRDSRILETIRKIAPAYPEAAVSMFGSYGDPEGILDVVGVALRLQPDGSDDTQRLATECLYALEDLDYDIPVELEQHLLRCRSGVIRSSKIGRNSPCPCKSGKKYKRCCGSPTNLAAADR